jgi:hypothetical protein
MLVLIRFHQNARQRCWHHACSSREVINVLTDENLSCADTRQATGCLNVYAFRLTYSCGDGARIRCRAGDGSPASASCCRADESLMTVFSMTFARLHGRGTLTDVSTTTLLVALKLCRRAEHC